MRANALYKIHDDPLVVATVGFKGLDAFADLPGGGTCLAHPDWLLSVRNVLSYLRRARTMRRRGKRLVVAANEPSEARLCRMVGIEAVHLNQNLHENEHVFHPLPGVPKTHDAVYCAQARPFKRLHLAAGVERLYVLTYSCPTRDAEGQNDLAAFEPAVAHADFNASYVHDKREVNRIYNGARVGLALSAREGAMFAAMQYLMAGLTVVTTPSRGGRAQFFDDQHVLVVPPRAEAVAEGVREMIARDVPPERVRERVLEKVRRERSRYVAFLRELTGDPALADERAWCERLWGHALGLDAHLLEAAPSAASA